MLMTIAVVLLTATTAPASAPSTQPDVRQDHYHKTITKRIGYDFIVRMPPGADAKAAEKMPLIIYLHGSGEVGTDLSTMARNPVLKAAPANEPTFPFTVIAPQMPAYDGWWSVESLDAMLDHILAEYPVDADRVYLTGASRGGYGVWDWACHRPDAFAAIAPIAGEGNDDWAEKLKHVPVWAFHGAKDKAVNPAEEERMVNAVNRAGGSAKLTMYPEAGHNAWSRAYNDPELYRWFLAHPRQH
jgi:predicted peptidase